MNSATQQSVLRLGKIDFFNTLPFFYSRNSEELQSQISFVAGSPREINEKMRHGEIDLGLASSFFYALHPEDFLILPGLCIGASGRSGSVILYSHDPIDKLDGKTIALSSKSLSAATLLRILLMKRWGFSNRFENSALPPEEMLERFGTCLLIGDEALFFSPEKAYAYDLSQCWQEWTGFPFCFALWLARKDYFEQNPSQVRSVHQWLARNLGRNLADPEGMVSEHSLPPFQKTLVAAYLKSLEYQLTPAIEQGLQLFFKCAADCGLASANVPLNFI